MGESSREGSTDRPMVGASPKWETSKDCRANQKPALWGRDDGQSLGLDVDEVHVAPADPELWDNSRCFPWRGWPGRVSAAV